MHGQRNHIIVTVLVLAICFAGCRKEDKPATISFEFTHSVGTRTFIKDSLLYVNAAGNHYEVNDLQYFVSEIILNKADGEKIAITADKGIHYVDIDIPGTLNWTIGQEIPTGEYISVSFIFGIDEAKNKTGLFVNPPERDMFWPEPMGGGYHYMKMNGQWLDTLNQLTPFNFHIGIGMENMALIQNYFTVQVPNSGVYITSGSGPKLILNMDIANWFETPNLWNWNVIGGQIMQKQWAMRMAAENGADAFTCEWVNKTGAK